MRFETVAVGDATNTSPTLRQVYIPGDVYVCAGWPEQFGELFEQALWRKIKSTKPSADCRAIYDRVKPERCWGVIPQSGELILTDENGRPQEVPDNEPIVNLNEDAIKITWIDFRGDPFPS